MFQIGNTAAHNIRALSRARRNWRASRPPLLPGARSSTERSRPAHGATGPPSVGVHDVPLVPESAQPVSPRRAGLRARGIHPRRRASDEFVEVIPGFLPPSRAPAVLALSARLLQREVAPGAVISHCTAAELLDVPLPRALEYATCKVIHCTLTPPERRHSGRGAVFHSRPTSATTSVEGVRVSGPLDLLVQLAEQLEHDDLVAAADQLVGPNSRVRPRPRLEHLRDRARKARNT